jgi:regulatory protein
VEDAVIEMALAEYEDWWRDLAVEVYQKRYHGEPPENFNDKARRANFLQSRGFTHEQIRYAMEHADQEHPDPEHE